MQIIIDEYKREIQKLKMQLSEQVEENVRLNGFKQIVMERPEDFDVDKSFENETSETSETSETDETSETLKKRIKELEEINKSHQKLNGDLRREITAIEQEKLELHADNKKLAQQIEDSLDRLRKSGM